MEQNTHPQHTLMIEEDASQSTEIDPKRARFPFCIVWTPLPVLSWFIPFIGHLGICREDGVILDFAGPNFVCVDNFAFGSPACYFQLGKEQCGYTQYSAAYGNEDGYEHNENGRGSVTWDETLQKSTQEFQHQSYNLLTCNCHSFVANCLNRLKFRAGGWNVVNLAIFMFLNGRWVNKSAIVKSYLPFLIVFGLGVIFGGATFLAYLGVFVFLLIGWFILGTYCSNKLIYV